MAVAEAKKIEKTDSNDGGSSTLSGPLGWLPRKWNELRTFFSEVRSELRKVTWPSRAEVYATTIVVIATSVAFGFYLFGMDLLFSRLISGIL
jgi:preprotein translocase subunit SecE